MKLLIWSILLIPAPIIFGCGILSNKVKISYKISLKAWFIVNIAVFYFSLLLMLSTTQVIMNTNVIENQNGILVQFIQQGGIVTIIMLLSSWVNWMLVQSADLDYAKGYSPIYTKIHFSFICAASALVCYLDGKSVEGIVANQPQYGQAVMWLVVLSQIWIGFGNFTTSRLYKESPRDILENFKKNFKYIYPCVISILVGPISFGILLYCVIAKEIQVPQWVNTIPHIFVIEAMVLALFLLIVMIHRMPPRWYDIYRIKKKIANLNKKKCIVGYYRGLKYQIQSYKEQCIVTIRKINIEIGKNNTINKTEKKKLSKFKTDQKTTMDIDDNKIVAFFDTWADEKKKIFDDVYKNMRNNYIEKNN